ncbi:glycosyltransferase, partial [bacterium]|nr:glycosyltransferase [bacterium]
MVKSKRIYFISFYFPPIGRGGAIIQSHFARGLAEKGWDINVISIKNPHGLRVSYSYDNELYRELKDLVQYNRIKAFNWWGFGELLYIAGLIPCPFLNWYHAASLKIKDIVNTSGVIYCTFPPFSNLLLGERIKDEYSFPLVIDYRDANTTFSGHLRKGFQRIEKRILSKADRIIVATPRIQNELMERYKVNPEIIDIVYNGYLKTITSKPRGKQFKIIYAGSISPIQRPELLAQAYQLLVSERPELKELIKVCYYGPKNYYYRKVFRKYLVEGISFDEYIPYEMLFSRMQDIDAGFFSLASERYAYATPTKLFEFIG